MVLSDDGPMGLPSSGAQGHGLTLAPAGAQNLTVLPAQARPKWADRAFL